MARSFNIRDAIGVDIEIGNGVDVLHDFRTAPPYSMRQAYSTVCIFNVLEHTFDPVTILRNALECTRLGGSLVVSTPANWPIHNYPKDYCRLLPDWYETFADQNGLDVIEELFLWQTEFGLIPVRNVRSSNRQCRFPNFTAVGFERSPVRFVISKMTHRIFHTFGRTHWNANCSVGIAFSRPDHQRPLGRD